MPGIGFSFSGGYRNVVELGMVTAGGTVNATGTAADGTNYTILGQILIPGGTLRANSWVFVEAVWNYNSAASPAKSLNTRQGANSIGVAAPTTSVVAAIQHQFWFNNSLQSQSAVNNTSWQSPGLPSVLLSGSNDYTLDQNITFEARWAGTAALGVDFITLVRAVAFAFLGP